MGSDGFDASMMASMASVVLMAPRATMVLGLSGSEGSEVWGVSFEME